MTNSTNPLPLSIGRNIFGLECETCGRTSRIVTEIVIDAPHRRPRVIGQVEHCSWCLRHEGDAPWVERELRDHQPPVKQPVIVEAAIDTERRLDEWLAGR